MVLTKDFESLNFKHKLYYYLKGYEISENLRNEIVLNNNSLYELNIYITNLDISIDEKRQLIKVLNFLKFEQIAGYFSVLLPIIFILYIFIYIFT